MTLWRFLVACLALTIAAERAAACSEPVCIVDYQSLRLSKIITFEDLPSSMGPGQKIDDVLVQNGAKFGERFAGQVRQADGDYDRIVGQAKSPLTTRAGSTDESLGIQRLYDSNVLLGYGPNRYPHRDAIGEGAIAVLFDIDQSAFGFRLRGGEDGYASIIFHRRDGTEISSMRLGPLGEDSFGFVRQDKVPDIAGFTLHNNDPAGIAIDDLIFDDSFQIGKIATVQTQQPG
ncbi:hypothetical protein ACFFUT_04335 [Pseudohalocynthiibacter aestuariivivens]|jgi:hypothetical protein|uniref:Uncharacterized protein n=1 Tax=Pseudohalocynthiibacter aestuariivivens TaxID=1591409 RepID=A0ABV5JC45_9RHOB|nr:MULTISPECIES: hypothetical protein [Pseudohalocynthiibacter]MBS9718397.1 hypothetical protein [Pseudohalocynthiibacter aestuariivivens]MCK0103406.1 hypothetical protein [Pseudohalocynthiibacter sp. F2068]